MVEPYPSKLVIPVRVRLDAPNIKIMQKVYQHKNEEWYYEDPSTYDEVGPFKTEELANISLDLAIKLNKADHEIVYKVRDYT